MQKKVNRKKKLDPVAMVNQLKDEQMRAINMAATQAPNNLNHAYWCGKCVGMEEMIKIVKRETGVI